MTLAAELIPANWQLALNRLTPSRLTSLTDDSYRYCIGRLFGALCIERSTLCLATTDYPSQRLAIVVSLRPRSFDLPLGLPSSSSSSCVSPRHFFSYYELVWLAQPWTLRYPTYPRYLLPNLPMIPLMAYRRIGSSGVSFSPSHCPFF